MNMRFVILSTINFPTSALLSDCDLKGRKIKLYELKNFGWLVDRPKRQHHAARLLLSPNKKEKLEKIKKWKKKQKRMKKSEREEKKRPLRGTPSRDGSKN